MLSEEEIQRYERQILIPDWGESGQEKIRETRVVVVGAGGLGSAVLMYLAIAGIGTIRIIDNDNVERSNLNRQIIHMENDIGKLKVESAAQTLKNLNPDIDVEPIAESINKQNVSQLVEDYLIVDALDNLETRLALNKASLEKGTPLFHGAIYGFEGRATTFIPGETPCLQCLYQDSLPGDVPVFGATPGVIGCIQAVEVIKYVLGIGDLLLGRLLVYDGRNMKFTEVKFSKSIHCEACR